MTSYRIKAATQFMDLILCQPLKSGHFLPPYAYCSHSTQLVQNKSVFRHGTWNGYPVHPHLSLNSPTEAQMIIKR